MKFGLNKMASVVMAGVLATNMMIPAFAADISKSDNEKNATQALSQSNTYKNATDSTNRVWVVDQKEEDVQVVAGYRYYYICLNCDAKFYYDQYPESDDDLMPGQSLAAKAVVDHITDSSCSGASVGYSGGKDPIYKTEHHKEIGHYEEISIDQSRLKLSSTFGTDTQESFYTNSTEETADIKLPMGWCANPDVAVSPTDDNTEITWKSSDRNIISVSSSSKGQTVSLEPQKPGIVQVTATTNNGAYVTFNIDVVPRFEWEDDASACYAYCAWSPFEHEDCDITSNVVKSATCSHTGETVYTASITVDGKTYTDTKTVETPKTENHSWDEGKVTTAPTCTEKGLKTYTCTECGATKTEDIPATGHSYGEPTFTWASDLSSCTASASCKSGDDTQTAKCKVTSKVTKEATCAQEGVKTYTAAVTLNGKEYTDTKTEKIAKTENHSWDNGKVTKEATCAQEGVKTYTCTVCGETKTEKIPKTENHSWDEGKVTTEPTCTKNGVKTYTCQICGKTKTEDIPATGHSYGEPTFTWASDLSSCTASVSCKSGDDTQTAKCKVTSKVTKEATCAQEGVKTYTAVVTLNGKEYTDTKTQSIPKTENHSWDEGKVTTKPTETTDGVKTYTCTVCGKTKTEVIPKTGSTYADPTFKWSEDYSSCVATAVCTSGGADLKIDCTVAHKTTKNPTCTKNGVETYTATVEVNGKTYTDTKQKDIPATGHSYGEPTFTWASDLSSCTASASCKSGDDTQTAKCKVTSKVTKEATCAQEGVKTYTAAVTLNGKEYTDTKTEKIAKTNEHSWDNGKVTKEATCAQEGVKTYTCTVCGEIKTEKIPKTEKHSWDEGVVTTQPTDTHEGVKTYTCKICGKTKTEVIPRLNAEYKEPTFAWSKDFSSCEATFVCTTGGADLKQNCTVTHSVSDASCETAGVTKHTATVSLNGKTYTDTKETTIPATGHSYGEPTFTWNGTKSCTATFTCSKCGKTSDVEAKIEKSGSGMKVTYTATAEMNGKTYTEQVSGKRFVDVADDAYYYDAVDYALKHKITAGTSETTFEPDENCTRAQIVQFLYNLDAKNTETLIAQTIPFKDVAENAWYATAVQWAYENNVTAGTSATTFSPNDGCTRAEVAQFLWNRAGKPEPMNLKTAFTDVSEDAWYAKAVAWAAENGITAGTSKTTFSPDEICSRAQIVTLIYHCENR